jgi:hypothetical protein
VKGILFFLVIICCDLAAIAQPDSTVLSPTVYRHGVPYIFVMNNGERYSGFIVEETAEYITIRDRETREENELRKSEITRSGRVSDTRSYNELMLGTNDHKRDYLLSSSAFLFEPSTFTSKGHWFIMEEMDYAFSENLALSVNSIMFYPMTLGLKCAFRLSGENYIGANVTGIANVSAYTDGSSMFIGYMGLMRFTHGNDNRNFTASGGILGLRSNLLFQYPTEAFINVPFTSFAFCNRFAPQWAVNIEGWYLPAIESGMGGIGFKFFSDETTCWNFGCYTLVHRYNNAMQFNLRTLPIPYLGLSRRFSND